MIKSTHVRSIILVLIVVLFMAISVIWGLFYFHKEKGVDLRIENGMGDLREVTWDGKRVFQLSGNWLFYPNHFIRSEMKLLQSFPDDSITASILNVPSGWKGQILADGSKMSAKGFGTYRLNLFLDPGSVYGIRVPDFSSAYRLYINGVLFSQNGVPGENIESTIPQRKYLAFSFTAEAAENVIDVEVANFRYRVGGMWHPIEIGSEKAIFLTSMKKNGSQFQLVGVGLMITFLLLLFYSLEERKRSWLYLSLLVFSGIIRVTVTENMIINLYFDIPWNVMVFLEFQTMVLIVIFTVSYFYYVLAGYMNKYATYLNIGIMIIYLFYNMFVSSFVYSSTLILLQLLAFLSFFHCLVASMSYFFHKQPQRWLILLSVILILVGGVNDIMIKLGVRGVFQLDNLAYLGVEATVVIQLVILFIRFNKTHAVVSAVAESFETAVAARTQELEQDNLKLQNMAMKDSLTSLNSRQKFDADIDLLQQQYKQKRVRSLFIISALFLDLDNFKYYNDHFGHPAGDRILQLFAQLLQDVVRISDKIYRIGGDEFVVLLPKTGTKGARSTARRILNRFRELAFFKSELEEMVETDIIVPAEQQLSCSIGVATHVNGKKPFNSKLLIKMADEAMFKAKESGKNSYKVYDPSTGSL